MSASTVSVEVGLDKLLKDAGWPEAVEVKEFPGGRNNRVFRVKTSRGMVLLKRYFREPSDPRDRLAHEYGFLRACQESEVSCVPRAWAADPGEGLALYEYMEGSRPTILGKEELGEAGNFIADLNARRSARGFQGLPAAAEACFSVQEHVASVERRMERLEGMEEETNLDRAAKDWVKSSLSPAWRKIRGLLENEVQGAAPLESSQRVVSPSDFGIHNTLRAPDGRLIFLDFEYSGWDDPAKLICDFANQPDRPLSLDESGVFVNRFLSWAGEEDFWKTRFRALAPLHQVKWACIVLNDFLPFGRNRRRFQDNQEQESSQKERQLGKAKQMLLRIKEEVSPC
jgi:aminoglycoside phosphotransferase (APT) family kinase protein